jgi:hypothetical protein
MTVPELKVLLKAQGLPVSGKKADLLDRLVAPPSLDAVADAPLATVPIAATDKGLGTAAAACAPAVAPAAARAVAPMKLNLLELQPGELEALLKAWGQPAYRANQVGARETSSRCTGQRC